MLTLTQQLPNILNALHLFLLITHHAQRRRTNQSLAKAYSPQKDNTSAYMNFFLSCTLNIFSSILSLTTNLVTDTSCV